MALSAFAGAVWRAAHQLYRLEEQRPFAWSILQVLRPAFAVVGIVYALVSGWQAEGVLAATAAGTGLATLAALVDAHARHVRSAHRRRSDNSEGGPADGPDRPGESHPGQPEHLGARVAGDADVGGIVLCREPRSAGSRLPRQRLPARMDAARTQHDQYRVARPEWRLHHNAGVFTLFVLLLVGVLALTTIASGALVGIAGPAFQSAAPLIPVVSVGICAQLVFVGVYRATTCIRRWWFVALHFLWLMPYALVAVVLIPLDANYAVALAEIIAGVAVTAAMVGLDRRQPEWTPIPWARLGIAGFDRRRILGSAVSARCAVVPDCPACNRRRPVTPARG